MYDDSPFHLLERFDLTVAETTRPIRWPVLYIPHRQLVVVSPHADYEARVRAADYLLAEVPRQWSSEDRA